ncbi:MAG: hypothetical protein KGN36_15355 [Acidobacteriota bacterium]|nr:hypothetical protein [Acidobacteriota bacterium]
MKQLQGIAAFLAAAAMVLAQGQPAATRSQVSGTITAVDAAANHLTMKGDKDGTIEVNTTARTLVLRIPPGETDPKKGTKVALSSLVPGDRAVVVGPAPEGNTWNAGALLVMTRADVASLQQKDQDDWRRRGTTGNVTALDSANKTITIKSGAHTYTVTATDKTTWNRYAVDSSRFADAKTSSFDEVKSGDQLRVLGNKSEDGATIQAEKIVFGSFRQIAATVTNIDPAKGEMTVKDLATKKPLVIKVSGDSTMRRLPEPMAAMLARRYAPGAQQQQQQQPPQQAPNASAMPGRGAGRGPGGGDVGQMLDRLPAMELGELKPGDAIMVSTTQGADPGHATAIMLLAGVEPLLTASPTATRDIMSGWDLGGGGGGGDTGQ